MTPVTHPLDTGLGEHPMKHYLLNVIEPVGPMPPPEFLANVMRNVAAFEKEIKAAGAWVFNGALHPPSSATVVRMNDGEALMTDGPFAEGKEHIGGFMVIKAPDLDAALAWAKKMARAIPLPIEVRPFRDEPAEVRAALGR
jgi:hypothetical protein